MYVHTGTAYRNGIWHYIIFTCRPKRKFGLFQSTSNKFKQEIRNLTDRGKITRIVDACRHAREPRLPSFTSPHACVPSQRVTLFTACIQEGAHPVDGMYKVQTHGYRISQCPLTSFHRDQFDFRVVVLSPITLRPLDLYRKKKSQHAEKGK